MLVFLALVQYAIKSHDVADRDQILRADTSLWADLPYNSNYIPVPVCTLFGSMHPCYQLLTSCTATDLYITQIQRQYLTEITDK